MKKIQLKSKKKEKDYNLCINMSVEDLKKVYTVCGTCLDKSYDNLYCRYIYAEIVSGISTFISTNLVMVTKISMVVSCSSEGSFILPVIDIPCSTGSVTIEVSRNCITFVFPDEEKHTVEVPFPSENYPKHIIEKAFSKEATFQVVVSKRLLKKILTNIYNKNDEMVVFNFTEKHGPVILEHVKDGNIDKDRKSLLMPIRLPDNKE